MKKPTVSETEFKTSTFVWLVVSFTEPSLVSENVAIANRINFLLGDSAVRLIVNTGTVVH